MSRFVPTRCRSSRRPRVAALLLILLMGSGALSHPQILFARMTTQPESPPAQEPFAVEVTLTDSSNRIVTDLDLALLIFEPGTDLAPPGEEGATDGGEARRIEVVEMTSPQDEGPYQGSVPALPEGDYPFRLAELVEGEIESNATDVLPVGAQGRVELDLLMPPATAGLGAWLVWLVGLPLLAGLLVTILIITSKGKQAAR